MSKSIKTCTTQKMLAKALGISEPRVTVLIRDPEWRWGRAPWNEATVKQVKTWLANRRMESNAGQNREIGDAMTFTDLPLKQREQIRLIIARRMSIELEMGKLLRQSDIENMFARRVLSLKTKMLELPLRASLIAHKSETECEVLLREWMKEICEYYAGGGQ